MHARYSASEFVLGFFLISARVITYSARKSQRLVHEYFFPAQMSQSSVWRQEAFGQE